MNRGIRPFISGEQKSKTKEQVNKGNFGKQGTEIQDFDFGE